MLLIYSLAGWGVTSMSSVSVEGVCLYNLTCEPIGISYFFVWIKLEITGLPICGDSLEILTDAPARYICSFSGALYDFCNNLLVDGMTFLS